MNFRVETFNNGINTVVSYTVTNVEKTATVINTYTVHLSVARIQWSILPFSYRKRTSVYRHRLWRIVMCRNSILYSRLWIVFNNLGIKVWSNSNKKYRITICVLERKSVWPSERYFRRCQQLPKVPEGTQTWK